MPLYAERKPPTATSDPHHGIRGWLILVAIIFILTPFRLGYAVYSCVAPMIKPGAWQALTTPGEPSYHPLLAPLLVFEIISNLGFLIFSLIVLVMFFQKKKAFPRLAVILFLANLSFIALDFFIGGFIPIIDSDYDSETFRDLGRIVICSLIWVPYMLTSKRVKATFVA